MEEGRKAHWNPMTITTHYLPLGSTRCTPGGYSGYLGFLPTVGQWGRKVPVGGCCVGTHHPTTAPKGA